jgi:dihydrofolate synthase / folylpolyglutamate synthase
MNYQETLDYLYSQLPMFQRIGKEAYKANLNNTLALDAYFNHPHLSFDSIHIAGTNGKGTTSHILAAMFQAAGYKTGLYTSPHLKSFRERIKVNGIEISEDYIVEFVSQNGQILEAVKPSFFEMTVALAFNYFKDNDVEIAIIETGMGGRLDSTNIINPKLSVITNISMDHTQFLGDTLTKIAIEKGGIIKKQTPVIIGESSEETDPVFREKAEIMESSIHFASKKYTIDETIEQADGLLVKLSGTEWHDILLKSDLAGAYQFKNIRTAFAAFDVIRDHYKIELSSFKTGLSSVRETTGLIGRWHFLCNSPRILCDTAHNEAGIKEVLNGIKKLKYQRLHMVIGVVKDKDVTSILNLLPKDAIYYFTKASIPRALEPKLLLQAAAEQGLHGNEYSTVIEALNAAKSEAETEDLIFIGGSTFVVAELF